jgi:hypothetical protein
VKRRLEKFGVVGTASSPSSPEDKSIIEERKKKFGDSGATVSLEDEIKKNKPIKKFHPKFNNQRHDGKSHQNNQHFRR